MTVRWFAVLAHALLWSLLPRTGMAASGCAPSTEAAVLQALGGTSGASATVEGFRVRDVVVDPLLHRAFVHVEQCGHPERPLVLLPFAGATARTNDTAQSGPINAVLVRQPGSRPVLSGSEVEVAMGGAHMRLAVRGRLLQNAAIGSEVEVQVASLQEGPAMPGDPGKRVHGRLVAANRVEVQP